LTSDPENLFSNVHSHDEYVCQVTQVPPLSEEILCHSEQVFTDNRQRNRQTADPQSQCLNRLLRVPET